VTFAVWSLVVLLQASTLPLGVDLVAQAVEESAQESSDSKPETRAQQPEDEWNEADPFEAREDRFPPCNQDSWDSKVNFCEIREFRMGAHGFPVSVRPGRNGGVRLQGWDTDSIRVRVQIRGRAETKEKARSIASEVRIVITDSRIRAEGPETGEGEGWTTEFRVRVPRKSDVSVHTWNGPRYVEGVSGTMDLETHNGPMALIDLSGAVVARTENGPLHVALSGSRWNGLGLDAETHNGPLTLALPTTYSARLETGTFNGPVAIDYPIPEGERHGKRVSATLGTGGPPVRVVTSSGPFNIHRRR
jgi:hypothetical protein